MPDAAPAVLIIDNDESMVAALAARLESTGYTCVTASTGAQGLSLFRDRAIDLIITDLQMPAGSGVILANKVREASDVPIIVVTGFRADYRRELRSIPNVTLLEKPFETQRLIDLIEASLIESGRELPAG